MAIVNSSRTLRGTPQTFYTDDTAPRILAFLASVRPLSGVQDEAFEYGRSLIERIAMSAQETEYPRIRLSIEHCTDVLCFLAQLEPVKPRNWWSDPEDAPSHICGYQIVLITVMHSLEAIAQTKSP